MARPARQSEASGGADERGQYGYALDVKTSPMGLRAAQAHLDNSRTAAIRAAGTAPASSPITRYAEMFSGWGLQDRTAPRGTTRNG